VPSGVTPQSLSAIVRGYKSAVTKQVNEYRHTPGAVIWQRNYYDHIIRNDHDLNAIRAYIEINPARWAEQRADSLNPPVWNDQP
jgi:REP element-mobilizing transposase RayT